MEKIAYTDYLSRYQSDSTAVIPEDAFSPFLEKAAQMLDGLLMGRLFKVEDTEAAKHCLCEIAELLFKSAIRKGISREDNDGYSVTFHCLSVEKGAAELANLYLSATGLLYRGIG